MSKEYLILERFNEKLNAITDQGDIILEGVFAVFGVLNNNGRIYEENDYLPHLDYLVEKINKKKLMGELDHPEKFEVSLSKVSHIVESITYDKAKREVRGRVRLLDTPSGNIAKALVKAGIPISISSRAAGSVNENKKVNIRKIFTYDLVADPGFNEAVLSQINESLDLTDFMSDNKIDEKWTKVNESLGIDNEFVSIYEMKGESNLESITSNNDLPNKENEDIMNRPVLVKEMQAWSVKVNQELGNLNSKINEASSVEDKLTALETKLDRVVSYINEMSMVLDASIQFTEKVSEQAASAIDYSEANAKVINENAEALDQVKKYTEANAKVINENAEALLKVKDYSEELAKVINENAEAIEEQNRLIENTNEYAIFVKDYLEENMQYLDNVVKQANEFNENIVAYVETSLKESINTESDLRDEIYNTREFANNLSEKSNELIKFVDFSLNEGKQLNDKINYSTLSTSVDSILESVKKQSTETKKVENKYEVLNILNESRIAEFNSLDETKKEKVLNAINSNLNESVLLNIFDSAIKENEEIWLSKAPSNYREIFYKLDESVRTEISKQAKFHKFNDETSILNFWETRQNLDKVVEVKPILENKVEDSPLGYSNSYIDQIFSNMRRF